jgi:hypothetical protein
MTQSGRSRIQVRAYATVGQQETIALDYVVPFNATLIQVLCKYGAAPNAADTLAIGKESGVDPRLNIDNIRSFEVGANGWDEVICNEHFEYTKGDHLIITASNGDDLDIGVEAVFSEAG